MEPTPAKETAMDAHTPIDLPALFLAAHGAETWGCLLDEAQTAAERAEMLAMLDAETAEDVKTIVLTSVREAFPAFAARHAAEPLAFFVATRDELDGVEGVPARARALSASWFVRIARAGDATLFQPPAHEK